ncbi:MogA/MoaB family molybdenum cofactor biosynthesis protein [Chloroflexota bacterium]
MRNLGVLTISNGVWHGQRDDDSGKVLKDMSSALNGHVVKYDIVPDEENMISRKLIEWADESNMDIILTTGGTGLSPTDVTPEATLAVVDKLVPGITEAMRAKTFSITPFAILSRAIAGIRGKCLIINLPGSPKAVMECLEVVMPAIPHALEIMKEEVTQHLNEDTKRD